MNVPQSIRRLGAMVWDIIAELSHNGETQLDPDSAEAVELRKTAVAAVDVKGDDPGRELAYTILEWLQGMATFDAVKETSEAYELARLKART
jgi:hypothetical protein